jgi:hypothetical protein
MQVIIKVHGKAEVTLKMLAKLEGRTPSEQAQVMWDRHMARVVEGFEEDPPATPPRKIPSRANQPAHAAELDGTRSDG